MNFNKLFEDFKKKCISSKGFVNTRVGRRLFVAACAVVLMLFFAPMFHQYVGAAIFACVAAPYVVLLWRKYDRSHAIVPAVFMCIPMIFDMFVYGSLATASVMLVAMVSTIVVALHPTFIFYDKLKDTMYTFLWAGGICVAIVIVACLIMLLVSIVWWLFCIIAFFVVVALFFGVVLSTAAYTATDDRRQRAKKRNTTSGSGKYSGYQSRNMYNVTDYTDMTDDDDIDIHTDAKVGNPKPSGDDLFYDID